MWFQIFQDGPEYEARKRKSLFIPPDISLKRLHDAVPRHLHYPSTLRSLVYITRHVAFTYMLHRFGLSINPLCAVSAVKSPTTVGRLIRHFVRPLLWLLYWGFQGLSFAGFWTLGHEAGHNALSSSRVINTTIGLAVHTFVLTPYHAWRITHQTHHKSTNNLEQDETYIPPTRKDFNLPDGKVAVQMDYAKLLEETPTYTLFKMFIRQFLGFQLYLIHNRKGNPRYPAGTSHYKPSSLLFKPEHRIHIMISNGCIVTMLILLISYGYSVGWSCVGCHYLVPWLWAHNWIVMFTYLQHSDPTIPYYRRAQWSFARGALATVDRPLFGWVGRMFLHNISSDHVAHHFFPTIPFYNLPEVTEAIKPVLGEYYNYDSTPALYALWRSFTQCIFVESEGGIVFFKNRFGQSIIDPAPAFATSSSVEL